MHVLLIHQAFATLDDAGGTRHFEMASYLVEHGHFVTVICSPLSYLTGKHRNISNRSDVTGLTILQAKTLSSLHRSFFFRLLNFFSFMFSSFFIGLGVKNVDVVWGTSPPIFQGWTAWLLARLKTASFLFEVRDLWPDFAIAVGVLKNPLLVGMSRWLERFLYRHADRCIVNSPGYIDHLKSLGVRKVDLIPNGADAEMFGMVSNRDEIRNHYGWTDKFVILYSGAHGISNDLGIVLKAASIIGTKSNILFALVGDGKEKSNLQESAKNMKLDNLVFLPPVSKSQIPDLFTASDASLAILQPLDWFKLTYPNKVFDAMAAGKPVLLAINGEIRKVIEEFSCGVFVPPGNAEALALASKKMANDPENAVKMGQNGRKAVLERFDRQLSSARFLALLKEMDKNNA